MTEHKITLAAGATKVLHTAGMYCDRDIVVTADGGGKREGTAIPVGQHVDRIYFNTELPVEEMRAYLSQLTYIQTPLLEAPLCAIYVNTANGQTGFFVIATKISNNDYAILCITNVANGEFASIYGTHLVDIQDQGYYNGWQKAYNFAYAGYVQLDLTVNSIAVNGASIADFSGLPVGAENEKIKNVLSITPF